MKKELLNAVAIRLNEQLNSTEIVQKFGKLNYIARFRNQFNNPDEIIPNPAIAIEFPPASFSNKSKQQQEVTFLVRIHVHIRELQKQQLKNGEIIATKELEYQEEVNKALHGWKPECFTTLSRVDESEDVNYDFGITDTVSYQTSGVDVSADKRQYYEEVEVDLEVEDDVINIEPQETPYKVEV